MAAIIGKTTIEVDLLMQVSDGEPVSIGTLTIPLDVATISGPELPVVGDGERLVVKAGLDHGALKRSVAAGLREAASTLDG